MWKGLMLIVHEEDPKVHMVKEFCELWSNEEGGSRVGVQFDESKSSYDELYK
jgi:hypothetical protein